MNERYENYESKKVDKVLGKCELITHKKKVVKVAFSSRIESALV